MKTQTKIEALIDATEMPPAPPAVSDTDMLRAAVIDALLTIETDVAAQWGNEKFNEGARAAAQVLRAKLGLGAEEPLPAAKPAQSVEAPC